VESLTFMSLFKFIFPLIMLMSGVDISMSQVGRVGVNKIYRKFNIFMESTRLPHFYGFTSQYCILLVGLVGLN
jgi:hypothetical protein